MESTLKSMVLSLFGITLVASASVAGVNELTKEPIEKAKAAAVENSLRRVLPAFDDISRQWALVDDLTTDVYIAKSADEVVGYAVKSESKLGYGGSIILMVGISPSMKVLDVSVLSHKETPGLGSKMEEANNSLIGSVKDKSLDALRLKATKDGGDLDALTGATITSNAYGDAVERAYNALKVVLNGDGGGYE